jgi:hypothetical protein
MEYEERESGGRSSEILHFIGVEEFRALKTRRQCTIVLLVKVRVERGK